MEYWQLIDPSYVAFSAANELLKLAVRGHKPVRGTKAVDKRLNCFHSWRAALQGQDLPLDLDEMQFARKWDGQLLHLVTNNRHKDWVEETIGQPAICLPLTSLQDEQIYQDLHLERDFDIFFSCMFTEPHIRRKRVDLLFRLLDKYPSLRVAWVGGYAPYERWSMEHSLNRHYFQFGLPGPRSEPAWTERESALCWYFGGRLFDDEVNKQQRLKEMISQSLANRRNIQFYSNLSRPQMVNLLNRCKASLCLSTNDLWPRSLTEAMACGTPAIAVASLISGLESLRPESGVIVKESAESVMEGLEEAWRLPRARVRETYFSEFGLRNGIRCLVTTADKLLPDWHDIVTVERPAESAFKRSLREQVTSLAAPDKESDITA